MAKKMKGGEVVCLSGDLGAGKTTFAQGFLRGLGAEGPFVSPTFLIMKQYKIGRKKPFREIYHIDAYRVNAQNIIDLGWEEIVKNKNNIIIIEWAEKISEIIPQSALEVEFEWLDKNKRKIRFKNFKFLK